MANRSVGVVLAALLATARSRSLAHLPRLRGGSDSPEISERLRGGSDTPEISEHYELLVIGGGSGGLACAKEAAKLGASVCVADFVRPSPRGTKWGLGGTCVNVGCIPKKLMHRAGLLGRVLADDAPAFGWAAADAAATHDWPTLVQSVQDHVKSLNWGYRSTLQKAGVRYVNRHARLGGGGGGDGGARVVVLRDAKGSESAVSADHVVVAVGGRPRAPADFAGAEHCITSDDLFSLERPPKRVLVVGGGYVALESAGFLRSLGCEVTVLVRSEALRGFDAQCAALVVDAIQAEGTEVLTGCTPLDATAAAGGDAISVRWKKCSGDECELGGGEFDTVLLATGRAADTAGIGLEAAGVELDDDGCVRTHDEATAAPNIYALGDVAADADAPRAELTPVAARAGVLLARRLFGGAAETLDVSLVPTAVFTPLEYACIGMTEEAAIAALGDDNVEVYHSEYTPLEWTVSARGSERCYAKLICDRTANDRVVGLHLVGENAGEIVQGFAVALRLGATYGDFERTFGIHPTSAEELVSLPVTKRSGESPEKTGC